MAHATAAEGRIGAAVRWRAWLLSPAYLVVFLGSHVYYEVALRAWAMGLSRLDPAGRTRRFNALIRQWGSFLFRLTSWTFGFRLEVEGEVPPGRHVVISNHQSTADISILMWVLRSKNCKFAVKRELSRFVPTISTAVNHGGFAVISRESSRGDIESLRDMARALEAWDGTAILFVEGTRSRDGRVLPYRAAAARVVARESGLPLLPVAIDGTWRASTLLRFPIGMPGRTYRVVIGQPVPPPARGHDVAAALEDIRAWTVATLGAEDSAPPLPHSPRSAPAQAMEVT